MSLVNLPTAQLTFRQRDASGSVGHYTIHVPYATLAAVAITAADALVAAVSAITGTVNLGYELTYAKSQNAPGTPTAGSRVENKGQFVWLTANGRSTQFNIPGINDAVLLPDGRIDPTNAEIILFVAAVTGVDAVFASADGSDITALNYGRQMFRGTRKNQAPPKG